MTKQRNEKARVHFPVRILPEAAHELRDRAKARFGDPRKAGRLVEEFVMPSRRYTPTPEQADGEPVLRQAWLDGLTEAETIQLLFQEARRRDERLHDLEPRTPCQDTP